MEKLVVQQIEAWERDGNPAHLLRAIEVLQALARLSAGMAGAAATAVGHCAGSATPPMPADACGYQRAAGAASGSTAAYLAPDAPPGVIHEAAARAKNQVHQTVRYVQQTAARTERTLRDALDAWRADGLRREGGTGGFGGRASGQIPQQGAGFGGRAAGPAGSGFGGRASGTIR